MIPILNSYLTRLCGSLERYCIRYTEPPWKLKVVCSIPENPLIPPEYSLCKGGETERPIARAKLTNYERSVCGAEVL